MVVLRRRGLPWSGERRRAGVRRWCWSPGAPRHRTPRATTRRHRPRQSHRQSGRSTPRPGTRDASADHHRLPDRRRRVGRASHAQLLSGPADDTTFPGVVDGVGPRALYGHVHRLLDHRGRGPLRGTGGRRGARAPLVRRRGPGLQRLHPPGRDPPGPHDRSRPRSRDGRGPHRGLDHRVLPDRRRDHRRVRPVRRPVDDARHRLTRRGAARHHTGPVRRGPQRPEHGDPPGCHGRDRPPSSGTPPAGWVPLCADRRRLGARLHVRTRPERPSVVGPAQVADRHLGEQDSSWAARPTGDSSTSNGSRSRPPRRPRTPSPPNPSTALERITLADGSRSQVLVLPPGEIAGPITR